MANYGTVRRPSAATPATFPANQEDITTPKGTSLHSLKFFWPFSIPPTRDAAAARLVRNLSSFALFYAEFTSIVLLITLIPQRKVSLVYFVIMKEITAVYLLVLHAAPNSVLLHKIIDKRLVLFALALITASMLILTRAAVHMVASVGGSIPVVLLHAVLWGRESSSSFSSSDDDYDDEEEEEEGLVNPVNDRDGDNKV